MPRAKTQKITSASVESSDMSTPTKKQSARKKAEKKQQVVEKQPVAEVVTQETNSATIDIEKIKAELFNDIKKQVEIEYKRQMHLAEIKPTETLLTSSELSLSDKIRDYSFINEDGILRIKTGDSNILTVNNSQGIGIGIDGPKAYGKGSVHIRSNYSSEAALPSTGLNSTRGLIVESDSDDEKTYLLRAVSRSNRQGLNLTGDGSLILGLMNDATRSRFSVYQPNNEFPSIHVHTPSRYYNNTMVDLEAAGPSSEMYNFLEAKNQAVTNGDINHQSVFKVNGKGDVYSAGTMHSTLTGYAEMFEWADSNSRNENRNGFTVALNSEGKLVVADEGDEVLGVVVKQAAFVGNSMWNHWHNRFDLDVEGNKKQLKFNVIEWKNSDSTLTSGIDSTLPANTEIPERATTYETDPLGNDMYMDQTSKKYDTDKTYTPRHRRQEWATVLIQGSCVMYKGQISNSHWLKVKDLDDVRELWILR